MLLDARTLEEGARLEADVCVVGAGPAGLAVTFALESAGANVVVLAGGGDPSDGEVEGAPYPPLDETRSLGIGGTAALWDAELAPRSLGARLAPLAPIDFEERPDVPGGGWPFGRDTLDRFYARAQELCDAGPYEYDAPPPFGAGSIGGGLFRYSPAEAFTVRHRDSVARSQTARVVTGGTATRIHTLDRRSVAEVEAASVPGRDFRVSARAYVLASGGIENPRLLLLSELGSGVVGCCFMDHPTIRCRLEVDRRAHELDVLDTRTMANRLVLGRLELSEETMRSEHLLNGGFFIAPARDRELRASAAARMLVEGTRTRTMPSRPFTRIAEVVAGADALAYTVHRRIAEVARPLRPTVRLWRRSRLLDTLGVGPISGWSSRRRRAGAFDVYHVIEQIPDPHRRIALGSGRDAFGRPVAKLNWYVGDRELESAERAEQILARELRAAGLGRLLTGRELAGDVAAALHPSAHHHLGTTRMHRDPAHGVVDDNCRVHGVSNLFVTGGSVFPSSGYVNPTLTIVALALRLGEFLRKDLLT